MQAKITKEDIERVCGVNPLRCMRCGKCSATCPAFDAMEFHPHQVAAMIESGNIAPLLSSSALFLCMSCLACIDLCPRGVAPAKLIEAVRLAAIRQWGANHLKAEQIQKLLLDDAQTEEIPQQAVVAAFRKYAK